MSTSLILNELIYDFYIKNIVKLITDLLIKNFDQLRLIKREKIDNIIIFINAMSKTRYDNQHKVINLKSLTYLKFHHNYFIFDINFRLFNQRVNFFKIFEKIENLAYKLTLSEIIYIHSIILIAQLKPALDSSKDFYQRILRFSLFVEEKKLNTEFTAKNSLYKIDKLINKRDIRKNVKYLIH